jgi:hypothetical protein
VLLVAPMMSQGHGTALLLRFLIAQLSMYCFLPCKRPNPNPSTHPSLQPKLEYLILEVSSIYFLLESESAGVTWDVQLFPDLGTG